MRRIRPREPLVVALLGVCLSVAPTFASDPAASDVLAYRGDHERSGVMPGPGPAGAASIRWSFAAGGPIGTQVAVLAGTVYLVVANGTLQTLDLATGGRRWTVELGAPSRSSPAIVDDIVIVGTEDGSMAVTVADGSVAWKQPATGDAPGSAAVVDGTIVVAGATSSGGLVTALEPTSGLVRWSVALDGQPANSVAAASDLLVVAESDGAVLALDPRDGSELWRHALGAGARIATPTIAGGLVYLATLEGGAVDALGMDALDARDGSLVWHVSATGGEPVLPPAVANGRAIYAGEDGSVNAVDASTGAPLWHYEAPGVVEVVPAITHGTVYAATNGGVAFALDAATGGELWRVPIEGVPYGAAVTDGLVLVGTNAGLLYAIGGDRTAP